MDLHGGLLSYKSVSIERINTQPEETRHCVPFIKVSASTCNFPTRNCDSVVKKGVTKTRHEPIIGNNEKECLTRCERKTTFLSEFIPTIIFRFVGGNESGRKSRNIITESECVQTDIGLFVAVSDVCPGVSNHQV